MGKEQPHFTVHRRLSGILSCTIGLTDQFGAAMGQANVKHFPRNGDIVVTRVEARSREWFRLAARDADNWVHHYDVIHAQDNKVGAFMQRERKLSSNDDWVLYSACVPEST